MTSVLGTPLIVSRGGGGPEGRPSALASDAPHRVRIASQGSSAPVLGSAESRTFELVRTFLEHLAAKSASSGDLESAFCSRPAIDWAAVEAAIDGSLSLEKAVGRAVVVADHMRRSETIGTRLGEEPSKSTMALPPTSEIPFFSFSVAELVPDFGDESRYRTKVARRVATILRIRRQSGDCAPAPFALGAES